MGSDEISSTLTTRDVENFPKVPDHMFYLSAVEHPIAYTLEPHEPTPRPPRDDS